MTNGEAGGAATAFARMRRAAGAVPLLLGLLLCVSLAGCGAGVRPAVPSGEAGYVALAAPAALPGNVAYAVRAGDVVSVQVFGEPDLGAESLTVDEGGRIALPLIGEVAAAGSTAPALADRIEELLGARYLRDPRVTVTVQQTRAPTITVEGEVKQPGAFPYAPGHTLLTALAQAQSPTSVAALDQVVVFRTRDGERLGGMFDLRAIRAGRMPDVALLPGDVVVVGHSARRAALRGLFRATPILGAFGPL